MPTGYPQPYPQGYPQPMHTLIPSMLTGYTLPLATYSSLLRFSALYSGKTYLTNHFISTRLFPIPLSNTPIVQKMINLFNLYKEVRL